MSDKTQKAVNQIILFWIKKAVSFTNLKSFSPVLDVRDVPCGVPGAVEPVAAGTEVAGEEVEDKAPATETD